MSRSAQVRDPVTFDERSKHECPHARAPGADSGLVGGCIPSFEQRIGPRATVVSMGWRLAPSRFIRPKPSAGADHCQLRRQAPLFHSSARRGHQLSDRNTAGKEPLGGRHQGFRQARQSWVDANGGDATGKSPPSRACARWPSPKSTGSARSLPWFEHVPHSRHRRTVDDRRRGLKGMHSPLQRRRARPLSARSYRHACECDVAAVQKLTGFNAPRRP